MNSSPQSLCILFYFTYKGANFGTSSSTTTNVPPIQHPPSPSPSASSSSTSSGVGAGSLGAAELSRDFRARRFMASLLMANVADALQCGAQRRAAIDALRQTIGAHDADARLGDKFVRGRYLGGLLLIEKIVGTMYLKAKLLAIQHLYDWQ